MTHISQNPRLIIGLAINAIAIIAAIAGCSQPGAGRAPSHIDNGWPPERFRGDVVLRSVEFIAPAKIAARCGLKNDLSRDIEACTFVRSNGDHTMILANPCKAPKSENWAKLACHEIGHLNSWPANHGG